MRSSFMALLCLLSVSGCVKSISSPMRPATAPSLTAPPDRARLVVVRPSRQRGAAFSPHLVDGRAAHLGDAINNSVFSADLAPGEHELCVGNFSNSGPLVKARLAAGKTYLVRVDIAMGYPYLTPLRRGHEERQEVLEQVRDSRGAEFMGPSSEDALGKGDLDLVYSRCVEMLKDTDAKERAQFTLAEDDAL